MRFRPFFITTVLAVLLTSALAAQQKPAVVQTLVYALNMTGGPGGARNQTYDLTMTVAIATSDPDGTRHATITMQSTKVQHMDQSPEEATITPAGAIVPKDAAVGNYHTNMTQAQAMALSASAIGAALTAQLRPFNAFAEACAQQQRLQPGVTWHGTSENGPQTLDMVYTVKGPQQKAGRNTMLVSMQSASPTGPQISGEGYYDPAAHLVVNLHYEGESPNGKGNEVVDIGLIGP